MKSWEKLEPDRVRLLTRHFTPGRGGRQIRHVTIHHMAMIGGLDECWNVWQTREASAHYTVSPTGEIGQAVWDRDTPWANANLTSNQETIAIEHSNSGGAAQDWPIGDKTIEEGAHLVAAICKYYKLGRPVSGKNIRFHETESGGLTACPYHLRPGRKYHARYMQRAQYWYDQMTKPARHIQKPAPKPKEEKMTDFDQISRRYGSRVPGSKVTMTPLDMVRNIDAHAFITKETAARLEKKLDAVLSKLEGK